MALNLSGAARITIPEGDVKSISIGGTTVWERSLLPPGYLQLEYVKYPASSSNILDTGKLPHAGTWELVLKMDSYNTGGNTTVFGSSNVSGRYLGVNQNGKWGGGSTTSGTYCSSSSATVKTKIEDLVFNSNGKAVSGDIGTQSFSRTGTSSAAITNAKVPAQSIAYAVYVYSVKCGSVFNGIPAKETSTGKYGLYDLVSNSFIGFSDWTGALAGVSW